MFKRRYHNHYRHSCDGTCLYWLIVVVYSPGWVFRHENYVRKMDWSALKPWKDIMHALCIKWKYILSFLSSRRDKIEFEDLPFPAREDETGGLGLPVPSEK